MLTKSFTMTAKFSGKCPHCGQGMTAGVTVIAKSNCKWGHETCPVTVATVAVQTPKNALPSVSVQPSAVSDVDDLISGIVENDNVFILKPSFIPSKMAKQYWEIHQEHNIKFVAYTRSKHGLYFVE